MLRPSLKAVALVVAVTLLAAPLEARRRSVSKGGRETNLTTEQWLKLHAIPFATAQPETGFDDLARLSQVVGDARIVSLGEATHGTREFFQMKHRILEYLVENMGFTVFAIEAALPECDAINDYVLNGVGDPSKALAGQHFWTWNTDEVFDMIVWMRNYNLRRGERPPVYFRGFDMQYSEVAMTRITAYLQRIDPPGTASVASGWTCFAPYAANQANYFAVPSAQREACGASIANAYATLESRRADYTARSSAAEFETMLHYARVIVQHEAMSKAGTFARGPLRDASMAENVKWLADIGHPGEKLVLWAHNYHAGTTYPETMGTALRGMFGSEMVIFGFVFDHGQFTAVPLPGPHSVPAWSGGHEEMLRTASLPRFILDLRTIESTAAQTYFEPARTVWTIGAVFNASPSAYREPLALRKSYDAIIWFEETTASKLRLF